MGCNLSSDLIPPYDYFGSWNYEMSTKLLAAYRDKDYDFGIDATTIERLLSEVRKDPPMNMGEKIVAGFSKGSGMINALSLITGIIFFSATSDKQRSIEQKCTALFNAFDFDDCGEISYDELTILLFSLLRAVAVMTGQRSSGGGGGEEPSDAQVERLSDRAYQVAGKNADDHDVTRSDFIRWVSQEVDMDLSSLDIMGKAGLKVIKSSTTAPSRRGPRAARPRSAPRAPAPPAARATPPPEKDAELHGSAKEGETGVDDLDQEAAATRIQNKARQRAAKKKVQAKREATGRTAAPALAQKQAEAQAGLQQRAQAAQAREVAQAGLQQRAQAAQAREEAQAGLQRRAQAAREEGAAGAGGAGPEPAFEVQDKIMGGVVVKSNNDGPSTANRELENIRRASVQVVKNIVQGSVENHVASKQQDAIRRASTKVVKNIMQGSVENISKGSELDQVLVEWQSVIAYLESAGSGLLRGPITFTAHSITGVAKVVPAMKEENHAASFMQRRMMMKKKKAAAEKAKGGQQAPKPQEPAAPANKEQKPAAQPPPPRDDEEEEAAAAALIAACGALHAAVGALEAAGSGLLRGPVSFAAHAVSGVARVVPAMKEENHAASFMQRRMMMKKKRAAAAAAAAQKPAAAPAPAPAPAPAVVAAAKAEAGGPTEEQAEQALAVAKMYTNNVARDSLVKNEADPTSNQRIQEEADQALAVAKMYTNDVARRSLVQDQEDPLSTQTVPLKDEDVLRRTSIQVVKTVVKESLNTIEAQVQLKKSAAITLTHQSVVTVLNVQALTSS